jgi:transposase
VAGDATRPAAVADRILLLSHLAQRRDVGDDPHGTARTDSTASRPRRHAERCHSGQPVGQDRAKGGPRGYDAHKQVKGRKRHLLVDTQGFVLKVVVSAADVQDRDGARLLAHSVRLYGPHLPRLSLVWADAGYAGQLVDDLRQLMGWEVEVVKRGDTQPRTTFAVQPHRWIVERTFSWGGVYAD